MVPPHEKAKRGRSAQRGTAGGQALVPDRSSQLALSRLGSKAAWHFAPAAWAPPPGRTLESLLASTTGQQGAAGAQCGSINAATGVEIVTPRAVHT